jgi:hypothetical protein
LAACVATFNLCVAQEPKRHCRPAEWPKRLPALDAVVDSAALFDLIDVSPESDTTSMVVSILYKEDGPAAVRLVEPAGAPSPGTLQFLQIMSRGLRRVPPPSPMGALRVRVRAGPGRAGIVERSAYCPPELAPNGAPSLPAAMRVEVMPDERVPSRKIRVDVQLFIDETGTVSDVRLVSRTGLRELDESIVTEQRRTVFLPATIDGIPVPSWMRSNGTRMRL